MKLVLALSLLTALVVPAQAEAQDRSRIVVTPFVGISAGGDATQSSLTLGLAAGWIGAGRWGFEGEIADAPSFFEQDGFRTERRMTTAMGSAIYKVRKGPVTPYAAGGFGLIRPFLAEAGELASVHTNTAAFNVGGGFLSEVREKLGVRLDVRYIRSFGEDDAPNPFAIDFGTFGFWRVSGGVVIGF